MGVKITHKQGYNISLPGNIIQKLVYDYFVIRLPIKNLGLKYGIHPATTYKLLKRYLFPNRNKVHKRKEVETELRWCPGCKKWLSVNEFSKNSSRCRCKKCVVFGHNLSRKRALVYLGNKCSKCGAENLPMCCFQFHHRNPKEKELEPAHYARLNDWNKVKKELDKCDLLCGNCHAIIHHGNLKATEV